MERASSLRWPELGYIDQIVDTVANGGVILTANQRLSRTLRTVYDDHQLFQRRSAWQSPTILPIGSWLRERWTDALFSGRVPVKVMLSRAQEAILWRRIIERTPEGASLLDLRGTVNSAMQAWRLMHQYRLPVDGRCGAHEDWAAFALWAEAYRRACDENNWLDEARLADVVGQAFEARAIEAPPQVLVAGFDEFTPQQTGLLARLAWAELQPDAIESTTVRRDSSDAGDELRCAAEWARDLLRDNPNFSIGVVLLNLGPKRSQLERVFDEALHPERMAGVASQGKRWFHISIPDPLAGYPLVNSALLALRMAPRSGWALSDVGLLLRSTFFAGSIEEAPSRATIDVKLRRRRRTQVAAPALEFLAAECPALSRLLERWRLLAPDTAGSRLPCQWVAAFKAIFEAAGWPGDRVLSSAEYQVFESWTSLLHDFASLDLTAGPLSYGEAVARVHELALDTQFQPQDTGAPVQIIGALEAAGARFDALWICGATDDTWPAPAHPHPFLPLTLQKEQRLPHSSPEREAEFAIRTFTRLRASAPRLMVSWGHRAGDVQMRPSPLIAGLVAEPVVAANTQRVRAQLEQLRDESGPELENLQPRGGTTILKLQSRCPFQAFADLRLGARPLEGAELGLSPADRGSVIHEALRLFWEGVRDHATLLALDPEALHASAERAVIAALRRPFRDSSHNFDKRFRELEIRRLTGILEDWAELEKTRAPFKVAFSERERTIHIAGLEIEARIDRVDELPDGRQVILDYKATAPSINAWWGERPDEPQLPLYAIANDAPVAALAFAQVGPEGFKFKGLAADGTVLPGIKADDRGLTGQIEEWRRVLEPIARSFRTGRAAVDPKDGLTTCEQCRRMSLCRIHETSPGAIEDIDAPS